MTAKLRAQMAHDCLWLEVAIKNREKRMLSVCRYDRSRRTQTPKFVTDLPTIEIFDEAKIL